MSSTESAANKPNGSGNDDLDDLFGNDNELDHIFRDLSPPRAAPPPASTLNLSRDSGLGIDEEVEVERKARAPRVKLDETRSLPLLLFHIFKTNKTYRLLSQAGIPKLRRIAGSKLKFKGKGHEVGSK